MIDYGELLVELESEKASCQQSFRGPTATLYAQTLSKVIDAIGVCKTCSERLQQLRAEELEGTMDNCAKKTYCCDSCRKNGDCIGQGIDGQPRWMEEGSGEAAL